MKKTISLTLCLCLLLTLMGCGAASSADTAEAAMTMAESEAAEYGWTDAVAAEPAAAASDEAVIMDADLSAESANYESSLKIIRTGNLSIESEAFDETDAFIRQTVSGYEGILAESSISGTAGNRWASYTVRIPSESFDEFFYALSGSCTVTSQTVRAEDVTEQYTDLSTQLETNKKKYARLLELMDEAETLTDLYSIETEVANVEYEIDRITGILNGMDSRVSFSTIYIDVQETARASAVPDQPSFGASLSAALKNGANSALLGLQNLIISIAYHWFFWLCFIILIAAALLTARHIRRKRKKAASAPNAASSAPTEEHTDK